jgi:tetratricopeptide (TPR) repeat protein
MINPKYAGAWNDRGYAYELKGDPGRAIADYDTTIELDLKYALAYQNRGRVYYANGEP